MIAGAMMMVNHAGLAKVFANFDTNSDGGLNSDELFADFRMDRRSFRAIVKDPKGVDWKSFAQRFGKIGFLIAGLLQQSHRPRATPNGRLRKIDAGQKPITGDWITP